MIYIANVGDSKAFLLEDKKYTELTYEHRGSDPSEILRVEKAGGKMLMARVEGSLAVTRAFGDFGLKGKV